MASIHTLACIFRNGDLPFRPRYIAQHFVVQRVKDDPLRSVQLYRELLRTGGTNHAAELFLGLLEQARTYSPWVVWMWNVIEKRPAARPISVKACQQHTDQRRDTNNPEKAA